MKLLKIYLLLCTLSIGSCDDSPPIVGKWECFKTTKGRCLSSKDEPAITMTMEFDKLSKFHHRVGVSKTLGVEQIGNYSISGNVLLTIPFSKQAIRGKYNILSLDNKELILSTPDNECEEIIYYYKKIK